MNELLLMYFILQVIFVAFLIIFVVLFFKANRALVLEERLLRFSLHTNVNDSASFFDKVRYSYYVFIKGISSKIGKSSFIKNYSKRYEKYVSDTKIIRDSAINIVSNKIVFSIFAILITVISDVLRHYHMDLLQFLLVFLIGFFVPDVVMLIGKKRMQRKIEQDFLKSVIIMNNAFKSGRSIIQAIEVVSNELSGTVSEEFRKMHTDLTYGLDLEVVFERFSKRINLEESKYMASSLVIINKTGGDIVKVFSSIEKSFLARKRLNDELKSSTALSNFVFKILIMIPFVIFIAMFIINPSYFDPFVDTFVGKIILFLIIAIYIVYILIIKKVMNVKE